MPFDRSRAEREKRLTQGFIDIPDLIHASIAAVAAGK
jgi:hypothetical protein